jgi:Ni/Co efflux regulator RcnB
MHKKILVSALMAVMMVNGAALAQDRGDRGDRGNNSQDHRDGRGNDGRHDFRGDDRRGDGRRDDGRRDDGRRDFRGDDRRGYQADRGAGPRHDLRRGGRLPAEYRHRQYVVDNWRSHRLSAPPRGYHWVQTGSDYVLVGIATGIIANMLLN